MLARAVLMNASKAGTGFNNVVGVSGGYSRIGGFAIRSLSTKVPEEVPDKSHIVLQDGEEYRVPATEEVLEMPRKFRQLSNESIFELSIHGKHGATRERLVREIMRVDNCSWVAARDKVREMNETNDQFRFVAQVPYYVGVSSAFLGGFASLPLVFHKGTVIWFAENIVKMDPADIPVEEMTSWWTVGSFSWSYMEPLLGTLSFVLLAAQFMRNNMQHLEFHPYSSKINSMRGNRLCKLYPKYDENIVREFAITDSWNR
mmetsp:Transcript_3325/g.7456  ORF Transcript_3325/g.7456 Transcript_3325/m.7456 type:complete len:259 (+) Transcript_3325:216-992(+)|eukprot:CAMPEP_0171499262 /NCGR_PEP_ID=MMETSP0958-20121227/8333_1 /TAXON_ID=87120 /ORGANISM="Aurantiochytrium limacinum, Strain ATCCMYA-1381" /LENGTH=258 /DNA_ID=CAMNT_0012033803 /DNA_START=196 /DNA_END=972 /DNA_ORIENTATION=-